MTTKEEIEEAAQLRFLALQSMVKRMRHTNPDNRVDRTNNVNNYDDDPDINLLRAAALKTIANKKKVGSLSNKDDKYENRLLRNEKKRSISDQERITKNNKYLKPNKSNKADNGKSICSKHGNAKNARREKRKCRKQSHDTSVSKSSYKPDAEITKIVRNGCIQLSNLDSEKVDETMILHITFSSSDDSSSDSKSEIVEKHKKKKKKKKSSSKKLPMQKANVLNDSDEILSNAASMNGYRANNCMRKLTVLMRTCESEIGKRNEQMKILLEAYDKYQTHNQTLCNILQAMKSTRDELSKCSECR